MNETIDLEIWQRPENEEKIKNYIEAMRAMKTVVIENFVCVVSSYECDNSYPGITRYEFRFLIVNYVKGKK